MFNENVSALMAFSAGVLSFFSPCTLPLVPAYIMYMADLSDEKEVALNRGRILRRTLAFIAGFTCVFLLLGFSASSLGRLFAANRLVLMKVSGVAILLMGLHLMGVFKFGFLSKYIQLKRPKKQPGILGAFVVGILFAAGWSPCFGPVLASILMMATGFGDPQMGMMLLGLYALGMGVPFVITALFTVPMTTWLSKNEKYSAGFMKIGGVILAVTGALMATNLLAKIGGLWVF